MYHIQNDSLMQFMSSMKEINEPIFTDVLGISNPANLLIFKLINWIKSPASDQFTEVEQDLKTHFEKGFLGPYFNAGSFEKI